MATLTLPQPPWAHISSPALTMITLASPKATPDWPQQPYDNHNYPSLTTSTMALLRTPWTHHDHSSLTMVILGSPLLPCAHNGHHCLTTATLVTYGHLGSPHHYGLNMAIMCSPMPHQGHLRLIVATQCVHHCHSCLITATLACTMATLREA